MYRPTSWFARPAALLLALGSLGYLPVAWATQDLDAGQSFTCRVTAAGAAECWGNNAQGQLGTGDNDARSVPAPVQGLDSGVVALSVGQRSACALGTGGAVWCWGFGFSGELGNGANSNSNVPVPVTGLGSGVQSISVGGAHACAVLAGGAARCWGANTFGQLGNGEQGNAYNVPVAVSIGPVISLSAGELHSCAVTTAGAARCWGANFGGGLGDGTQEARALPGPVSGLASGMASIHAGNPHSCALSVAGAVHCWGQNQRGEVGDGIRGVRLTPFALPGLASGVAQIDLGSQSTCARRVDGSVLCWGRNTRGQAGDGSSGPDFADDRLAPVAVIGLGGSAREIAVGTEHACAVSGDGRVRCWGANDVGELGIGSVYSDLPPTLVRDLPGTVVELATSFVHSCARISAGGAVCWGDNDNGQLGVGSRSDRALPATPLGLSDGVQSVAVGSSHSCAVRNGTVMCWGANDSGQLGSGDFDDRLVPTPVAALGAAAVMVSAGNSHSCALTVGGAVKCWGSNFANERGDGLGTAPRASPGDVIGLGSGVAAISSRSLNTCARLSDASVRCWGSNSDGQLGIGNSEPQTAPVVVASLPLANQVSVGASHACARDMLGALRCWGSGDDGRLGNDASADSPLPVLVDGASAGATWIDAGFSHTCALLAGGAARCWGRNFYAQLGDRTRTDRDIPTPVLDLDLAPARIHAGGYHSCAVSGTGEVACWGYNANGQLGNGEANAFPVPQPVLDPGDVFFNGFE